VRDVVAGDPYVPVFGGGAAELIQYEATYSLINVPAVLQAGQNAAGGVFLIKIVGRTPQLVDEPAPFAITGGTGPYKNARGEGSQSWRGQSLHPRHRVRFFIGLRIAVESRKPPAATQPPSGKPRRAPGNPWH
jgi:hypothetical protein